MPPARLHAQLLELTAIEAPRYDDYCRGEDADAVSSYLDREFEWIEAAAAEAPDRALALDLGCATGQVAEFLQSRFDRVRGFDISPAMIEHARARCAWNPGVELEVRDLDDGIPAEDGAVSLAVANFGAASELAADLLRELARVLRPGGRAVLSWYNREALVNEWFYPWPATVHSHLNPHNDTLEVWSGESVYTIRARAMTVDGGRLACESAGLGFRLAGTFPTLQPILPAFVARNPRARALYDTCRQLDDHLAAPGIDRGSFIIAVASRPGGLTAAGARGARPGARASCPRAFRAAAISPPWHRHGPPPRLGAREVAPSVSSSRGSARAGSPRSQGASR